MAKSLRYTLDDFLAIATGSLENLDDAALPLGEWQLRLARSIESNARDYVPGLDDEGEDDAGE